MDKTALVTYIRLMVARVDSVSIMLGMDTIVPFDFHQLQAEADEAVASAKAKVSESANASDPDVQSAMDDLMTRHAKASSGVTAAKEAVQQMIEDARSPKP